MAPYIIVIVKKSTAYAYLPLGYNIMKRVKVAKISCDWKNKCAISGYCLIIFSTLYLKYLFANHYHIPRPIIICPSNRSLNQIAVNDYTECIVSVRNSPFKFTWASVESAILLN